MSDGQPRRRELADYLDGLARLGGAVSAVEALITDGEGTTLFRHASGYRVGGEKLQPGARFDAASLTKPWMATLALALATQGKLDLATPLRDVFPGAPARSGAATLEDLLRHRSGIAAWSPLALRLGKRLSSEEELARFLLSESLWPNPDPLPGELAAYSDLGYILWGLAAEKATGRRLPDLLDAFVAGPLGLAPLGALAGNPPPESLVECRLDNGREVDLAAEQGLKLAHQAPFLRGVPQDGNARALGTLAGHAGLFVTAEELLGLGREWMGPRRVLTREAVNAALAGKGGYALGWARRSAEGSSGAALEVDAFGHSGFTGGSLWIEPGGGRIYVVLAHRLASRLDFNPVRHEMHRLASGAGEALSSPS